jgi:hypothetical protein
MPPPPYHARKETGETREREENDSPWFQFAMHECEARKRILKMLEYVTGSDTVETIILVPIQMVP